MKKLIALLAVLLVFTGCGASPKALSDEEAKTLYSDALDNIKMVNADIEMTMSEGEDVTSIIMKMRNADNYEKASAQMSMSFGGESMQYFFSEKHMYVDLMGMKMKIAASEAEFNETFNAEQAVGNEFTFDEADYSLFTVSQNGKLVTYAIDTDKVDQLPEDFKGGKGTISFVIDSSTKQLVSMEANITEGDSNETIKLSANYTATDAIAFPDLSEYQSIED